MDRERLRQLLAAVAAGELAPEAALERLAELPYADLGFAKLDLHRELRAGLAEAVYGEGKTLPQLRRIVRRLLEAHGRALVTRLAPAAASALRAEFPDSTFHERARLWTAGPPHPARPEAGNLAAVIAAGTSDLPVAEEAAECLRFFGHRVETFTDLGIAGLHRLLAALPRLRRADVLVVAAGMDGALPAAVAGLVEAPVVAVPTSVGYGAGAGGLAPLLTMLNACAPGVAVVNIDNGYGAAVVASRVLRRGRKPQPDRRDASIASP